MRYCLLLFHLLCVNRFTEADHLLHWWRGEVAAEQYQYYQLSTTGPISLILHSLSGDADLYISQARVKPSYLLHENDASSYTCGVDRVDVPVDFTRPLWLAVYGHPFHEHCEFQLEVWLRQADIYQLFSLPNDTDHVTNLHSTPPTNSPLPYSEERDEQERSVAWEILWTFIEVLLEALVL